MKNFREMTRPITVPEPLPPLITNWRHGLYAALVFIVLWALLFFAAFMTAFGNPTPTTSSILHATGTILTIVNPYWGIPLAYILGAYFAGRDTIA